MRPNRSRVAACLFGLVVLGGCGDAAPDPLAGPGLPPTLESLTLDTLFQVGAASGESWETFAGVWDIEVDAGGRLAVLDLGGPSVHIYGAQGEHLATIDEPGLDPGQLDGPSGIAWAGPGELLVWDPGSSWISSFQVRGSGAEYVDRWRAFAFGETGFCSAGGRTYLSYLQDDIVVHEVGPEGPVRSFGPAPVVVGAETLGLELRGIALEEMTPSALLCTGSGVVDVSFLESSVRLHDPEGAVVWSREFDDFRPIVAYSDDGIGLGRRFDEGAGSHLLRSVAPWGDSLILVQHEVRSREIPDENDPEVFETRLLNLADGVEVARTRALPLILTVQGQRLYLVQQSPFPMITVVTGS
jgi:hypothetical protein